MNMKYFISVILALLSVGVAFPADSVAKDLFNLGAEVKKDNSLYERYDEFLAYIRKGGTGLLIIGGKNPSDKKYQVRCWLPSGSYGLADGEYDCYLLMNPQTLKDEPVMVIRRPVVLLTQQAVEKEQCFIQNGQRL